MPRSQPGTVYRGHFRGIYELGHLTGLAPTTLYRWHARGWLTEAYVDEDLRKRGLREKARSIGLPRRIAANRCRNGWDDERAYTTPRKQQPQQEQRP